MGNSAVSLAQSRVLLWRSSWASGAEVGALLDAQADCERTDAQEQTALHLAAAEVLAERSPERSSSLMPVMLTLCQCSSGISLEMLVIKDDTNIASGRDCVIVFW